MSWVARNSLCEPFLSDIPEYLVELSCGKEVTETAEKRTANDQRSDALNQTSSENKAAGDNRANQLNPNNPAYRGSRGKK